MQLWDEANKFFQAHMRLIFSNHLMSIVDCNIPQSRSLTSFSKFRSYLPPLPEMPLGQHLGNTLILGCEKKHVEYFGLAYEKPVIRLQVFLKY